MTVDSVSIALAERFGWIALDFVNTIVRTRSGSVDAFTDVEGLLSWMDAAAPPGWETLRPGDTPGRRTLHQESIRLRVAIDRLLDDTAERRIPDEALLTTLRRPLGWTTTTDAIDVEPTGRLTLDRRFQSLHPAAALSPILSNAVELVGSVQPSRLRRCRADLCLRWFVDTSKGGQRAWCSMATCGNRAKAARYRARHEP